MLPDWNDTLLRMFLDSSLRVAGVAAAVALILLAARIRHGAVRHAAWTAVLIAMLLMPVLPYCVPSISIPVSAPAAQSVMPAPVPEMKPSPLEVVSERASPTAVPAPSAASSSSIPQTDAVPAGAPAWPAVIIGAYFLGAAALLLQLLLGWRSMNKLVRASRLIPPETIAPILPMPGTALLFESEWVAAPLTAGVISPRILLPAGWREWPGERLKAVVAHESAHVQRRDPLVGLLARLNRCIFWFHPLAWWLERKLAETAEQACDDVAVRAIGKAGSYAEVLLDIAEAVHTSGGRFSWQGIGVNGTGLLGRRIDRILRGEPVRELSRARKAAVTLGCGLAIFLIVACSREAASPPPLQPDPEYAKQQEQQKEDSEFSKDALAMNVQQVADLEASLKANPEDLVALKKLLIFYRPFSVQVPGEKGKWAPVCAQVLGEKECIRARRPLILWVIEHYPESDLAAMALIYPTPIDPLPDPVGYEEAKKLWLAQANRPEVRIEVLKNAANFFFTADKPLAEQMMLRAQVLDPKGNWSSALGRLYAFALVGSNDQRLGNVVRSVSFKETNSLFVQEIRKKLTATADARMLYTAGEYLTHDRGLYEQHRIDFDPVALGRSYIERALDLDPDLIAARSALARLHVGDRILRLREILKNVPRENQARTIAALPASERFEYLPWLSIDAYMEGDSQDYYKHDTAAAKAAWERARNYARDGIRLASGFRDNPEYSANIYMGNLVQGLVAFREGDKREAVNYLLAASYAPASEDLDYYINFHIKLTGYLLKYGERDSVIEFLERIAQVSVREKQYLLESAAKIRDGIQPLWYPKDGVQK